jgi:hypothetical protein
MTNRQRKAPAPIAQSWRNTSRPGVSRIDGGSAEEIHGSALLALGAALFAVPLPGLVLELGALCQRQIGKRDVGLGGGYDGVGEAEFNALCPVGELVAVPYGGADLGGELLPLFRLQLQVVRFEVHALMIPEGIVERNTPRSIYLWVLERPEFSHAR